MQVATGGGPEYVARRFRDEIGQDVEVGVRQFGGEKLYLVQVPGEQLFAASPIASALEAELAYESDSVVVTVRPKPRTSPRPTGPVKSLQDPRVDSLVQLLTSRSRTSEAQPSLSYIPNNTANLAQVTGTRHHLIFGRRGAGKTALLIEARRFVEADNHLSAWLNIQPLGTLGIDRIFLYIVRTLLETIVTESNSRGLTRAHFLDDISVIAEQVESLLAEGEFPGRQVRRLLPEIQRVIKRATASMDSRVYLFLDDFYYVPRQQQPDVLELLHASIRDSDVWLKIASIKHLSRWYRPNPPTGLQTGQDANIIDLDLSLQNPNSTIEFLSRVFSSYCSHVGILTVSNIMLKHAIDRLVFASGGVPRDFLTLSASAIGRARLRSSARTVGISDVNQAAGDAAKAKVGELEDDLASNVGFSTQTLQALTSVRELCLDEKGYTYFRIDFRDKERHPDEYGIISRLLEVRLIHLIDPSVSDRDRAGERSECYTLDLSQYSGYRLKQNIRVLDFKDGLLISKRTRPRTSEETGAAITVGRSALQVIQILRVAPLMNLTRFRSLVQAYEPMIDGIERLLRLRQSWTIDELVHELRAPYQDVAQSLSDLIDRNRVKQIDADGEAAYTLSR